MARMTRWRGVRGSRGEELWDVQKRRVHYDSSLPSTAIIAEPNELSRLEADR